MRIRFSDKIYILEYNSEQLRWCENNLVIPNPEWEKAERMGLWNAHTLPHTLSLYERRGNCLVLPFGLMREVMGWIRERERAKGNPERIPFETYFNLCRPMGMKEKDGGIKLYPYQEQAVETMRKATFGILKAPCGSGKTQMALALIQKIGLKALWLTHTHKLLDQSKERAERYFAGDFGTITEGKVNIGKDITFATVQTMSKLDPSIYAGEFNVIVVDECHRAVGTPTKAMMFYRVLSNCKARFKFGVSATIDENNPMTKTMTAILGKVAYEVPESSVGEKIIKADLVFVENEKHYPILSYSKCDGEMDYNKLINTLCEDSERTEGILGYVLDIVPSGHQQLILTHRVSHAKEMYERLKNKDVDVSLMVGSVSEKKRNDKASVIVATYSLAKEGLDIPNLSVLHLATPQQQKSCTIQSVGRIERNVPGKPTPVVYDYVDVSIPYCINSATKRRRFLGKAKKDVKTFKL